MIDELERTYIYLYNRLHDEFMEAFMSLYYLQAMKELITLDERISFRNEFIKFLVRDLKKKLCSQIFKLLLDNTNKTRRSLPYFVSFLRDTNMIDNSIDYLPDLFMSRELQKEISTMRHVYISHIGKEPAVDVLIKIEDLESILCESAYFFDSLRVIGIFLIPTRFCESTLNNLKERCYVAIRDTFK